MSGLYYSGAQRLLAPYAQGAGVIFTLHHVRPDPDRPNDFAPNSFLEVTPEFLAGLLDQVQGAGLDVVSLDDAVQRLKQGDDRGASPASLSTTAIAMLPSTPGHCSSTARCR